MSSHAPTAPLALGVLISGRGSNMESLADACAAPDFPAEVAVVLSNVPDAPGLERARERGIDTEVVDHREHEGREAFEEAIVAQLRAHGAQAVCLAGFMRLIGPRMLAAFPARVLNIHPSLLPSFPGLHAHEQALEYGVRFSGCTVHFVTEDMDAGPIVLQAAVPVEPGDTVETVSARILEQEHRIYPEAVRLLAEGRLEIVGRRVQILERRAGRPGTHA